MKKNLLKILSTTLTLICLSANAQNQVYWREGFEPSATPACDLTTTNPTSITPAPTTDVTTYFNGNAGVWWGKNVYRTTGTGCPAGNNHPRVRNMGAVGTFDSGALVTPIVNFGIQEFHFSRARTSRSYTIWVTPDTSATTTNWQVVYRMNSTTNPLCTDTIITVASATAKRLKIVMRAGLDYDLDSMWLTSFSQILPVKFGSISASMNAGFSKINWNIESELNTSNYFVERSFNGKEFVNVANIEARKLSNYSWVDANNQTAYYRIKAIDKDGKISLSNIVKVTNEKVSKAEVNIYPNPATNNRINIEVAGIIKGDYKLNIYSLTGAILYTTSITSEGNSLIKTIDVPSSIKNGTFVLEVTNGSIKATRSIILN